MNKNNEINPGDIVRFSAPNCEAEKKALFVVVEVNGDRGFMKIINSSFPFAIIPTELVRMSDIEKVEAK